MRTLWVIGVSTFMVIGCSSTPSSNDGGSDAAGTNDAKIDHATPVEAGGNDAATCSSGLSCEICDGSFSTSQMLPPFTAAGQCTQNDISAFVTAGGSTGSQTDCDNWQTAEQTSAPNCLACTFSDLAGPKWGVYVCDANSGSCFLNTGGCLDVALGTVSQEKQASGPGSCGDLINDAFRCEDYACNACTSQSDYDACLQSADAHECVTYSDAANSTTGACAPLNNDASAVVNSCFDANDSDLSTFTTKLCGAAP